MRHPLLELPPLDMLRGFVAVGRRLSITLAAQDLCLTQSAVSRQVQALEEFFGGALLTRKHRAIELTPLGEQLFALASPMLGELAEFSISARRSERPRSVTFTASAGVTALWILPRLGVFQAAHEHIDVRVAATNKLLDLRQEGIDLAIRYCREADAPPRSIRLFGEEVVPVASPAVARRAFTGNDGLLSEVLLELDDRARPWLRWSDWLGARGIGGRKPRAYLYFNQYDQVIQAAVEGHGVGLAMVALVLPMLRDGRLVALDDDRSGVSEYAFWLVSASESPQPEVREFAEWILREAAVTSEDVRMRSTSAPRDEERAAAGR
jgi:DNA-binding transcriptional LysR family regulator